MVKFRDAGPDAAYEVAEGVTAEEAAKLGLAVVENDAFGRPAAYGRYKDAPKGAALGITVPHDSGTKVIGGGNSIPTGDVAASTSGKGHLINPDDPVIHSDNSDVHADNSPPQVEDLPAQEAKARKVAEEGNAKVQAKAARKSK